MSNEIKEGGDLAAIERAKSIASDLAKEGVARGGQYVIVIVADDEHNAHWTAWASRLPEGAGGFAILGVAEVGMQTLKRAADKRRE